MTTILIPEISDTGHHPRFLRHVLKSVDRQNANILIAGKRDLVLHSELDSVRNRFTPIEIEPSKSEEDRLNDFSLLGLIRRQFCVRNLYARVWREVSRLHRVDMVVVPFVDDCMYAFAVAGSPFGDTPWVGVSMRTQFHFPKVGVIADKRLGSGIQAAVFRHILRQPSLKVLLTIDPTLIHFSRRRQEREFAKVQYLPDPCESLVPVSKAEARKSLNIAPDCKVILVYGLLSERKGIFNLVRAMSLPECPENVHVILAGGQDAAVKAFLERPPAVSLIAANRLHMAQGYIPTSMVGQLVYASDAMWIGYIDFYTMSGVLVLAARHGLPSITSHEGIVGYLSRLHGCGMPVDPRSEESILEVLQRISRGEADLDNVVENATKAFAAHSHAEFYRIFGYWVRAAENGGRGLIAHARDLEPQTTASVPGA